MTLYTFNIIITFVIVHDPDVPGGRSTIGLRSITEIRILNSTVHVYCMSSCSNPIILVLIIRHNI